MLFDNKNYPLNAEYKAIHQASDPFSENAVSLI